MTNQKIIENILFVLALILIIIAFISIKNPKSVGHATEIQYNQYTDILNIETNSEFSYLWEQKNKGNIISININGEIMNSEETFNENFKLNENTHAFDVLCKNNCVVKNIKKNKIGEIILNFNQEKIKINRITYKILI